MTVKKSRLSHHEAMAEEISTTEVEIEDSEVAIEMADTEVAVTMDSEVEMTEDQEETLVTDPRDASTVARMAISPETANNVNSLFKISP